MTGTVVESRPGGWGAAVAWFLVAAAVGALGVAATPHLLVLALLPLAFGVAALWPVDPPVRFEVTADGLAFDAPEHLVVRYDELRGLTAPGGGRGERFAMQLYHPGGVVRIPAGLSVPSRDLYRHLVARRPAPGLPAADAIPPVLQRFAAEQVELFGPERVRIFLARPFAPAAAHRRHVAYSVAAAGVGLAWVVVGLVLGDGGYGWVGAGIPLAALAVVFAFAFNRVRVAGRDKTWQQSGLVIGPGGIALTQGALRGRMRWDELRAVNYPAKHQTGVHSTGGAGRGISLAVDGAVLIIADYYDHPLHVIHSELRSYWGGAGAN